VVFAPGEEFAGYTIESVLGTGGMGAVYLARHPRLPRRDALKLLNPAFSGDPNFRTRFEREADLASALIHRNIVAVYDRGAVDNQLWITMQYVAGVDASVAARSGDGSMTPHRVVHIISEVGSGLDYAHRAGLLHRDVKPANILLAAPDDPTEPEHVLLTDFGIAKSTDEVQHLTGTGNLLATLAYASPEQIEAKHLDHRVDIYALGCVLYELLTGSVPFPESSPFATMTAHLKNDPPKATDRVPWLPPGFDAVIAKAMAKNPDDRYNTCRELSLAARAALTSAEPGAATPTRAEIVTPAVAAVGGHDRTSVEPARAPAGALDPESPAESIALTTPRPPYTVSVVRTPRRSGAITKLGPVSTNYLSATDRIALEKLLHDANFFALPPRLVLKEIVPGDVLQEITVGNNEVTRTVVYEREGAKRPKELDEIVTMLEGLAGWEVIGQAGTGPHGAAVPGAWSPTGSIPPLGGGAARPTESYPPIPVNGQHTGPSGFYPSGPIGGPPPGGNYHSGPHTGGYQQLAAAQLTGPSTTVQKSGGSKKWILIALAAVLVIAGGVTAAFLVNRDGGPFPPATPASLAGTADGLDATVKWGPSTGATGYTLRRGGETVYTGVATTFVDEDLLPGKYDYTVTATNSANLTSPQSAIAYVTITHPWDEAALLYEQFPTLLPATPTDTGYDDLSCSKKSDNEGSKAVAIIYCNDPNGIYLDVMQFASSADKDAYLEDKWSGAPVIKTWTIDDVEAGDLYRSADDEAEFPYILTEFNAPAEGSTDEPNRENSLLYMEWEDHTYDELSEWWQNAAF
jgi:serine/threonine protein kinase